MTRRTILLVEDNPDDEELALLAFRQHAAASAAVGVHVQLHVAKDGMEAIEMLFGESSPLMPNLILLDLKLPKIHGIEVLRKIRQSELTKRLPVIILTSSNDAKDVAACYDLGCNSFVRKSVNFQEFLDTTRTLQQYWLHLNEEPPRYVA